MDQPDRRQRALQWIARHPGVRLDVLSEPIVEVLADVEDVNKLLDAPSHLDVATGLSDWLIRNGFNRMIDTT